MSFDDYNFFRNADYKMWNQEDFVSLEEFIHLIEGFEPLAGGVQNMVIPNGANWPDWDIDAQTLHEFKIIFKKYCRMASQLPNDSTDQTEVRYLKPDVPHYEATFLISWAKSRGIRVNERYKPIKSVERISIEFVRKLTEREILSRNEFIAVLAHFNSDKNEQDFKEGLTEAVRLNLITPIPNSQDLRYDIEISQRNYEYKTSCLINWAIKRGYKLPEQIMSHFLPSEAKDPDPRRINTLEKLVLGMAVDSYGYEQSNNHNKATGTARGSIVERLSKLGIALDANTVRGVLKEVAQKYKIKITE